MHIDDMCKMPIAELIRWLLDESRTDFDLYLGCGVVSGRIYPDHPLADGCGILYRASCAHDREWAREILRGWLEELASPSS